MREDERGDLDVTMFPAAQQRVAEGLQWKVLIALWSCNDRPQVNSYCWMFAAF